MSISSATSASSPLLQWLQQGVTSVQSSAASCAPAGGQSDTASISQQAVQLNAAQTTTASDPAQQAQGHHRHGHHHRGGTGEGQSFVTQLAQDIVGDLQSMNQSTNGSSTASDPSQGAQSASSTDDSFVQQLAKLVTTNLISAYQETAGLTLVTSNDQKTNAVA